MNRKGFTLIELLVVIAIIGLLSTMAIVALGSARQKSRDARRLSDLKSIQTALEMYAGDNGGYPASTSIQLGDANHVCFNSSGFNPAGCANPYLAKIPVDPGNGYYQYSGSGNNYAVMGYLEGVVNGLSKAVAVTPNSGLSAYDFTYGLVGWWKFDEGNNGPVAYDSISGNNSTWGGATPYFTTGKVGAYAGNFNGSDGYGSVLGSPAALRGMNQLTISAWVYLKSCAGAPVILGMPSDYDLYLNDSCLLMSDFPQFVSGGTAPLNQWTLTGMTYDGSQIRLYLNGQQTGIASASGAIGNAANSLLIGKWTLNEYLNGYIDDARIYNRALTGTEILALYYSQK